MLPPWVVLVYTSAITKSVNAADHEASALYAFIETSSNTPQMVVLIPLKTSVSSLGGVVAKQVTEAKFVQPTKAAVPMPEIPLGSSTAARLVQP